MSELRLIALTFCDQSRPFLKALSSHLEDHHRRLTQADLQHKSKVASSNQPLGSKKLKSPLSSRTNSSDQFQTPTLSRRQQQQDPLSMMEGEEALLPTLAQLTLTSPDPSSHQQPSSSSSSSEASPATTRGSTEDVMAKYDRFLTQIAQQFDHTLSHFMQHLTKIDLSPFLCAILQDNETHYARLQTN